jgi:hypothetical protein
MGKSDARTSLVLWILEVMGEPWLWSIPPEELGPFLKENDWTLAHDPMVSSNRHGVEFYGVALK